MAAAEECVLCTARSADGTWEEFHDEGTSCYYYVHDASGEVTWEPPERVAFVPTARLWAQLESVLTQPAEIPPTLQSHHEEHVHLDASAVDSGDSRRRAIDTGGRTLLSLFEDPDGDPDEASRGGAADEHSNNPAAREGAHNNVAAGTAAGAAARQQQQQQSQPQQPQPQQQFAFVYDGSGSAGRAVPGVFFSSQLYGRHSVAGAMVAAGTDNGSGSSAAGNRESNSGSNSPAGRTKGPLSPMGGGIGGHGVDSLAAGTAAAAYTRRAPLHVFAPSLPPCEEGPGQGKGLQPPEPLRGQQRGVALHPSAQHDQGSPRQQQPQRSAYNVASHPAVAPAPASLAAPQQQAAGGPHSHHEGYGAAVSGSGSGGSRASFVFHRSTGCSTDHPSDAGGRGGPTRSGGSEGRVGGLAATAQQLAGAHPAHAAYGFAAAPASDSRSAAYASASASSSHGSSDGTGNSGLLRAANALTASPGAAAGAGGAVPGPAAATPPGLGCRGGRGGSPGGFAAHSLPASSGGSNGGGAQPEPQQAQRLQLLATAASAAVQAGILPPDLAGAVAAAAAQVAAAAAAAERPDQVRSDGEGAGAYAADDGTGRGDFAPHRSDPLHRSWWGYAGSCDAGAAAAPRSREAEAEAALENALAMLQAQFGGDMGGGSGGDARLLQAQFGGGTWGEVPGGAGRPAATLPPLSLLPPPLLLPARFTRQVVHPPEHALSHLLAGLAACTAGVPGVLPPPRAGSEWGGGEAGGGEWGGGEWGDDEWGGGRGGEAGVAGPVGSGAGGYALGTGLTPHAAPGSAVSLPPPPPPPSRPHGHSHTHSHPQHQHLQHQQQSHLQGSHPQHQHLQQLQLQGGASAAAAAAAAVQLPARSGPCFASPLWEAYRTHDALLSRTALGGYAVEAAEGLWGRFREPGLHTVTAAVAGRPEAAAGAAGGGRSGGGGRVGAAPAAAAASPAPGGGDWASGDRYLRVRLSNARLLARGLAAAAPLLREAARASHHRAGAAGPQIRPSARHLTSSSSRSSSRHSSGGGSHRGSSDRSEGSGSSEGSGPPSESESGSSGAEGGSGGLSAVQAGRARWAVGRWGPTHSTSQAQQQQRPAPPQKPTGPSSSSSSSPAAPRVARFAEPLAASARGGAPHAGPDAAAASPAGGGVRAMASRFQSQR